MIRAPLWHRLGLLLLGTALTFPTQAADGPDWAREQRLDAQTRDAIFDGEPIDLEADGRSFLAIDMEPDGDSKGGVILMHGRGFQPDWHQVVGPLRVSLAEAGWRTLSIQMPVLEKQAKYYDYVPILKFGSSRVNAAIEHMRGQGVENIILLAHSCSVHMAMDWVKSPDRAEIQAFIGIGMGATDYKQPMANPLPLGELGVPVLDVRGSDDFNAVHRFAPRRWAAIDSMGFSSSVQVVIEDSNHYFDERHEALHDAVEGWLSSNNGFRTQ